MDKQSDDGGIYIRHKLEFLGYYTSRRVIMMVTSILDIEELLLELFLARHTILW